MAASSLVPWSWLAFLAVSPGAAPSNAVQPSRLHIELRHGGCGSAAHALAYEVAIARTEPERERGLGFRDNPLAKNEGMLFVYDIPGPRIYWMKDTHIPLAIFYFESGGKLLSSAEMPVEKDPVNPTHLYREPGNVGAVLEVPPGVTKIARARKLDTLCIP